MPLEYWLLTGRSPVNFSLPLLVTDDGQRLVEARICTPLLKVQDMLIFEIMSRVGRVGERDGQRVWMLAHHELMRVATKFEGSVSDPELLVVWGRIRDVDRSWDRKGETVDRDEFITFCHLNGLGENEEWVQFVWNQFTKLMAAWLISRSRPVDLGFAKLYATHYREDWKEILFTENANVRPRRGVKPVKLSEAIWKSRWLKSFLSLDLLAMRQSRGYCLRRLEIQHKPQWYKAMLKIEQENHRRYGSENYAKQVIDNIRYQLRRWVDIYVQWRTAIDRPCASRSVRNVGGSTELVPYAARLMYWKGLVHRQVRHPMDNLLETPPGHPGDRQPQDVFSQDGPVPEVPVMEPQAKDLRNSGRNMASPYNRDS